MRILFITNYYPPYEIGGYEQLCRDIVERLRGRGHACEVLTSDYGTRQNGVEQEQGVYRLLRIQPDPQFPLGIAGQFFLTRRRTEAYNREVFRQVVQQTQPDVVFIWNLQGLPYELALDAEALPNMVVAYWLAGYSPAEPDLFWQYWTRPPGKRAALQLPKKVLGRLALAQMRREGKLVRPQMHHVAVVSHYMRRKGLAERTLPPHTEVIYNGVETELFYRPVPPPDTPPPVMLLLAGRVTADKGVHVAVEAMGRLVQAHQERNFRLLIAGGGPAEYRVYLERLVATWEIHDLVSFTGQLPREQMPALMHDAHVLVLTAIHPEAFARVVLEGMAAGLAVVGTLTGGTEEILQHEVTGLACEAGDAAGLAYQVGRLLDDPHLRYRLAKAGQEEVLKHYTLDGMVQRVERFLRSAVEHSRG